MAFSNSEIPKKKIARRLPTQKPTAASERSGFQGVVQCMIFHPEGFGEKNVASQVRFCAEWFELGKRKYDAWTQVIFVLRCTPVLPMPGEAVYDHHGKSVNQRFDDCVR